MKSVKLEKIVQYFHAVPIQIKGDSWKNIEITHDYVHRLGLELMGYKSELGPGKIMVSGTREKFFLTTLSSSEKQSIFDEIFSSKFGAFFVTNSIIPENNILKFTKKYNIPVFSVKDKTSPFMSSLTNFLEEYLEPSISRPAGLVSVHGEGVLIIGESGIGKSEVALELIHRGHKFVSDDITEIRKLSSRTLIGCAPGNISRFIEVRGIGIINVQQLFGVNATKSSETIDLVINLEIWKEDRSYERLSMTEQYAEILGMQIPYISIPVKPGKNLAVIVEVAAMNNRLKKLGMNPYKEFMEKVFGENPNLIPKPAQKVNVIFQ